MHHSRNRARILVIDDERPLWAVYSRELGREGYSIRAGGGLDGLSEAWGETPDLVVLDTRLTSLDGLDVLFLLASRFPRVPIVVYSTYTFDQNDFRSWAADAYVPKSSDLSELKSAIRRTLSERARTGLPSKAGPADTEVLRSPAQVVEMSGRGALSMALTE